MKLNLYLAKDYENKSRLLTMEKQTQSNPILPATSFGKALVVTNEFCGACINDTGPGCFLEGKSTL